MGLQVGPVALSELAQVKLRESDILEIAATSGMVPTEALLRSTVVSDWWAAISDPEDGIVAVFGVAPSRIPGSSLPAGCPWLLATDAFYKHKHAMCRIARKSIADMHQQYPILFQFVDARHKAALEWVLWLGFDVVNTLTKGRNGETLVQVVRRAAHVRPQLHGNDEQD